jgi:hypothetical protein
LFAGSNSRGNSAESASDGTAAGATGISSFGQLSEIRSPIATHAASDFNGDGKPDMPFGDASGNYASWDISGNADRRRRRIRQSTAVDSILKFFANCDATWNTTDNSNRGVSNLGSLGSGWKAQEFPHFARATLPRKTGGTANEIPLRLWSF